MSSKFSLNGVDLARVLKNALIFLAPALIVLIASFQNIVPKDASWAVVALFVLNVVTDLIRKFVSGK
jgi:membrane protein YdbS with pleckstrin-like domain